MSKIKEMTTYHLMCYLINNNISKADDININDLLSELIKRSNKNFGLKKNLWLDWFYSLPEISNKEKKLIKAMDKFIKSSTILYKKIDKK